ncbi:ribosomal protein L7/L12 [Williamsia herbipolensis]|uniref:Ribosomal protein L7/L12 n=1 Tax=Williamsia herbipolensis TaxID=1603258 RepID=A0AAU4K3Y3_9NOCA|nr:ribosomal protein L7/L12 [Williamsia herbipolensis]MCX6468488.1 ribosomal protein L7/L12 [Mycobacteriales bacterium]
MTRRRELLHTGAGVVFGVAFVYLAACYVFDAIDSPSIYRVFLAIVSVVLAASIGVNGYRRMTGRSRPALAYPRVNPASVPFDDVVAVTTGTDDRIDAIRQLREAHPGLGLKDAKDLVDEVLARPDL